MSISKEERTIVVSMEIEKARKTFSEIEILRQAGLWDNIANRLYYAAFHAVSALLINDEHPVGTPSRCCGDASPVLCQNGHSIEGRRCLLFPAANVEGEE